jgi:hypothetical protein
LVKIKRSGILVGTASVYFVASRLAAKGFHAAPTFGNAPNVDILVGLPDGEATVSIQVKTTWRALRTCGRGKDKQPRHYECDVGDRSAKLNKPGLFFAFVDLKGAGTELPDVFIVPSEVIYNQFRRALETKKIVRIRWHPKCDKAEEYKNRWDLIENYLKRNENISI